MKRGASSLRERLRFRQWLPGAKWLLASAALGAVSVFGFAPFYLFPVPVLTLAGLAWLWQRSDVATHAIGSGLAFGLGYFLVGTSWVYVSMHDFGGMPWPIAGIATLIFCGFFALLPALAGFVYAQIRVPGWMQSVVVFPAAWTAAEWVRGWVFTGFPWLAVGYSQTPSGPLSGFVPLFGVYGVSLLVALSAGAFAWLARVAPSLRRRELFRHPLLWMLVVLWGVGFGLQRVTWTAPAGDPVGVTLIQGNIEQDMKWRPEWVQGSLDLYMKLTLAARSPLILLPETALPVFNADIDPAYFAALSQHARNNGGDLLLGIPEVVPDVPPRYYNSVISLGTQPTQTYRKYHLVPFGDYFPRWGILTWIMDTLQVPMSSFSRGDPYQRPIQAAGQKIAVNICYEDVFGEEIIRQLPEATLLANFTNDAWWGKSIASEQHLQMAQARAQETGRSMLRVTNTGVTAIIDERGRIANRIPSFVAAVLEGKVQGRSGRTPYVVWANWPVLALLVAALVWASFSARRSRHETK